MASFAAPVSMYIEWANQALDRAGRGELHHGEHHRPLLEEWVRYCNDQNDGMRHWIVYVYGGNQRLHPDQVHEEDAAAAAAVTMD
jgi:hypothetical protein